jgi:hypothetical protein
MTPKTGSELAMSLIQSRNPVLARAGAQSLFGGKDEKPFQVGKYLVDRNGKLIFSPPSEQSDEWEELPGRTPGGQMLQRNRRTGEIKAVGSGPPQPNQVVVQQAAVGQARDRVSENVLRLRDAYQELEDSGGSVKAGGNVVDNTTNLLMNTTPGQMAGRALGTRAQVARDKVASLRPALISEIRQATGMSARAMDSNIELQFYLKMATDTGVDPEVNFAALEYIDKNFGAKGEPLGIGVTSTPSGRQKLRQLAPQTNPIAPQGGLKRGDRRGEYLYLGGNPNDPNSWAKTP